MGADQSQPKPLLGDADLSGSIAWLENCLQAEVMRWDAEVVLREVAEATAAAAKDRALALELESAHLRQSLIEKDYALAKAEARVAALERALAEVGEEAVVVVKEAEGGAVLKEQAQASGCTCNGYRTPSHTSKGVTVGQSATSQRASSIRALLNDYDIVVGPSGMEATAVASYEAPLKQSETWGTGVSKAKVASAAGVLCGAQSSGGSPMEESGCDSEGIRYDLREEAPYTGHFFNEQSLRCDSGSFALSTSFGTNEKLLANFICILWEQLLVGNSYRVHLLGLRRSHSMRP